MDYEGALAYLSGHINLERQMPAQAARRLERIRELLDIMGDPQRAYRVIHITGTNGKGSTARMLTTLLASRGLSVGTYTSPHLERINERIAASGHFPTADGEDDFVEGYVDDIGVDDEHDAGFEEVASEVVSHPVSDEDFAEVIGAVSGLETMLDSPPTHFEILTAAAYRWFSDIAVDVAVVEVGMGGRYDATNVADGDVAVVTNVALDHLATIGPHLTDIATEKAGIVKPGSTLILGETHPELAAIFRAAGARLVWERDTDFGAERNQLAHDGRVLDLLTPGATYPDLFLPLHGAHQGDNAAAALAAAEAFFEEPLALDMVAEALRSVRVPGRLEVVSRRPLCLLDGAHNPAGAHAAASAVEETFGSIEGRIMVVGMLQGRDPVEMLEALGATRARLIVACPPPSPRAMATDVVAAAAAGLGVAVEEAATVPEAVATALALAAPEEMVFVTGSLYVVGAARAALSGVYPPVASQ